MKTHPMPQRTAAWCGGAGPVAPSLEHRHPRSLAWMARWCTQLLVVASTTTRRLAEAGGRHGSARRQTVEAEEDGTAAASADGSAAWRWNTVERRLAELRALRHRLDTECNWR